MDEWLANAKDGDKVILTEYDMLSGGYNRSLRAIVRATVTMLIIEKKYPTHSYEMRFSRKNGRQIQGDRFYAPWIVEATPETVAEVRAENIRQNRLYQVKKMDWKKATDAQLEAVLKIVSPAVAPIENK